MINKDKIRNICYLLAKLTRYNLKIIFANRFIYFLFAAIAFFIVVLIIMIVNNQNPTEVDAYYLLIFPGILLMFYPTVFGIQNDKDSRMLEIIFGIPNYRYKVYLVRLILIFILVFFIVYLLGWIVNFTLIQVTVSYLAYQLIYPLLFLGCLSFMFSTLVKNGNGTAVIMVIIGLIFWILSGDVLSSSKWNLFLNPFDIPRDMNETIWVNIVSQNRLYLVIGAIVSALYGLINLQQREKFV